MVLRSHTKLTTLPQSQGVTVVATMSITPLSFRLSAPPSSHIHHYPSLALHY
ncbi:hypothetical protein Hdeb2414_s0032g00712841 [Helianthus debilis subsp. tardiflorus]